MRIGYRFLSVVLILVIAGAVCAQEDPERAALMAYNKAIAQAKDDTARLDLLKAFIQRNPASPQNNYAVMTMVGYVSRRDKRPADAVKMIDTVLPLVTSADVRRDMQRQQLQLFAELGDVASVRATAGTMIKAGNMDYINWLIVGRSANTVKAFDLALTCFDKAFTCVTPESITEGNPNDPYWTPERLDRSLRSSRSFSLEGKGYAMVQLGQIYEGLAVFAEAEKLHNETYLGVNSGRLMHYWAETLIDRGQFDLAMQKIAPAAILGEEKDAVALLQKAYAARNGGMDGYDSFVWNELVRLAKPIDDFSAKDYEGHTVKISDFRGKVVLLNFWFPT